MSGIGGGEEKVGRDVRGREMREEGATRNEQEFTVIPRDKMPFICPAAVLSPATPSARQSSVFYSGMASPVFFPRPSRSRGY